MRRLAPVTATNAISIKDTPERIDAAARLIRAIDKARAEVVIRGSSCSRWTARPCGSTASVSPPPAATRDFSAGDAALGEGTDGLGLSVDDRRPLSGSSLFLANPTSLLVRLLETNTSTRILANPQLRTSDGIAAQAHFGERVPVPVTTFSPIAVGGINQQPITSYNYEEIGVNIDITPRIHHNDEVSLAIEVEISNVSGTGFGDLPQFGSRSIITMIRLRDGETNILAGLIRDDERESLGGVPGLSSIPILGRLFGRTRTDTQETDIILTLKPHIIRGLALEEDDLRPFRVGANAAAGTAPRAGGGPSNPPQPQPRAGRPLPGRIRRRATPHRPASPAGCALIRATLYGRVGDYLWRETPAPVRGALRFDGHASPERPQPVHDARVATLDRLERADATLPLRRERCRNESHSRSQVARVQGASVQRATALDDDAVGIAEEEVGAHAAQLLQRKEPQLVHPVVNEGSAVRLRRQHGGETHHVAGESGPRSGGDLGAPRGVATVVPRIVRPPPRSPPACGPSTVVSGSRSEPATPRTSTSPHPGDGGHHRPASGLDVVTAKAVGRSTQPRSAGDPDGRGSGSLDSRRPMPCRKAHSSTTCGSQAAWRISLPPGAAAAARMAVSVPVTDASSR